MVGKNFYTKALGIGKVLQISQQNVLIEFFHDPNNIEKKTIPFNELQEFSLKFVQNARVYYQTNEEPMWFTGRFVAFQGSNYIINTSNSQINNIQIDESKVYFRSKKNIKNTFEFLANRIINSKERFDARYRFIDSFINGLALSKGITALLSSSIELEDHQINVVRTVLCDPIHRYLLADEVGMGKTIEACLVIRQIMLDSNFEKKVLIIIPDHLKLQWFIELTDKFDLGTCIAEDEGEQPIMICGFSEVRLINSRLPMVDFIIIDEAHNFANFAYSADKKIKDTYSCLSENTKNLSKGLLLLSATPALNNEQSYLAMLTLLDPHNYSLNDLDNFRANIMNRELISGLYLYFNNQTEDFELLDYIELGERIFNRDELVIKKLKELQDYIEKHPKEITTERERLINEIRAIFNNRFRIHRRVLRNKRDVQIGGVLPGRSGLELIKYDDSNNEELINNLYEWRNIALRVMDENLINKYANIFILMIETFQTDTSILKEIINCRLGNEFNKSKFEIADIDLLSKTKLFKGESNILEGMLKVLNDSDILEENKIEGLDVLLNELINDGNKIVIFCSSKNIAEHLFNYLKKYYQKEIVRHTPEFNFDAKEKPTWYRFVTDDKCKIIICDKDGEEGLNLQSNKVSIVHYDLPFSPNRIEQRMGRVDRYGVGEQRKSYAFILNSNAYLINWVEILQNHFQVFDRSIARLQYMIIEKMKSLPVLLFINGLDYSSKFVEDLKGENGLINNEFAKQNDDIDFTIESTNEDASWYESLYKYDRELNQVDRNIYIDFFSKVVSLKVTKDNGFYKIKRSDNHIFQNELHEILVEEHRYLLNRSISNKWKLPILRNGTPLIDKSWDALLKEDYCSNFVIWRHQKKDWQVNETHIYFFVQLVIVGSKRIDIKLHEFTRIYDEVIPPIVKSLWVNENGDIVSDNKILNILESPFSNDVNNEDYYDKNIDNNWNYVQGVNDLSTWQERVKFVQDNFRGNLPTYLNGSSWYLERNQQVKKIISDKLLILEEIIRPLKKDNTDYKYFTMRKNFLREVNELIEAPDVYIISTGAVFVSGKALER